MIQIISYLNDVATKIEEPDLYREELVEKSDEIGVISLKMMRFDENFIYPKIEQVDSDESEETTISYRRSSELVKKVKKNLQISTNKDVGLRTFDYFIEMEGIENPNE